MKWILILALICAGAACTRARVATDAGTEAGKEAADITADALSAAVCAITIGAWGRMEDDDKRGAVLALCVERSALPEDL